MHSRYRLRTRHLAPLAAAALASAALAPSAGAAVANSSHIIEVVQNTSDVTIGGVDNANVELIRNGVVLNTGTATGAAGGGSDRVSIACSTCCSCRCASRFRWLAPR